MKPFKERYPIEDWILTSKKLDDGDYVVFEEDGEEVIAMFHDIGRENPHLISLTVPGDLWIKTHDVTKCITFLLKGKKSFRECTCGASYTSRPNFHLSYCDLEKL